MCLFSSELQYLDSEYTVFFAFPLSIPIVLYIASSCFFALDAIDS